MTAQELKNSILQNAVQGKLVPQDPSDEPASVLLERIKAEKAQLIKDKKIKAEKPLAPIAEEEIPFEIPESWEWVRLGDVSTKITDGSHNPPPNSLTGIPILSAANINQNKVLIETATRWVTESQWAVENKRTEISINDVLLTIVGTIGRSAVVESNAKFAIQRSVCVIKPVFLFSKYLALFLQSPISLDKMKDKTQGTAQLGIYLNSIKNLIFPLPPLAEQQRIVAKIEELMPLVEEYDKAEKELTDLNAKFPEQIKKSVLQYAIQGKLVPAPSPLERAGGEVEPASELLKRIKAEKEKSFPLRGNKKGASLPPITEEEIPFEIPESWVWVRLGEIVSILGDGIHGTPNYDTNGDYFFINGNNLDNGKIVIKDSTKRINHDEFLKHKKELNKRSILVSINGTLGNIAFYNNEKVILGKSACYFNLFEPINMEYVRIIIKSKHFEDYALTSATQTTIQNVSLKSMRELPIPLPPLSEQQRIVEKVEEVLGVCEELKA